MRRIHLIVLYFLILSFLGVNTQATPLFSIEDDPGTYGSIPNGAVNDVLSSIYGSGTTSRNGYYGSTVTLTESGSVTFTFLGFEAGYDNDFNLSGDELFSTEDYGSNTVTGISDSTTVFLTDGLIDFSFDINNDSGSVVNGYNPDDNYDGGGINFFVSFDVDANATYGNSLVLFLDDSGAGPDDNHDDFAVRMSVDPVPEPATLLLFGTGLAGLTAFRRKFRQS
jgi:hypothetical protein